MNINSEYLNELRLKMKNEWDRVLPTNELLYDRWEKAKFLNCGEGSSVYDSSMVLGDVKIGENTWVGPFTLLDGSGGGLVIGDYCSISSGVQIYTHDSVKWSLTGGKHAIERESTIIGDNCYIAPMAVISKGVSIGDQSVVAAKSFVNKSFEARSIIAGIPARKIGSVIIKDNDEIEFKYYK